MKRLLTISALALILCALTAGKHISYARSQERKDRFAQKLRTLTSIVKELETNYVDTLDAARVVDPAIDMMLYGIDPYTEYFPYGEQEELEQISAGEYAGIGATIVKRGNTVIISEPQPESPAERAGLRRGDVIVAINGDSVTADMAVDMVSKRLRGPAGTDITVVVDRPYVDDSILTVAFRRENIKVNPLPYYGIDSLGIGYVRLSTFNESAGRRVRQAVEALAADPALKAIVLDLRSNGGGLLEGAVQTASVFVPKGTEIVRTRGRYSHDEKTYKTTAAPVAPKVPLAILTDEGTASSSEIVAGSLQDLDRAVIIGRRSYGKGLVQTPRPLPYGDILKITTARYYIPSGRLIQALDYSRRDDDGRPVRTPDSLTNVYATRAGREVRDGGGITPDVTVEEMPTNRLLYNIVADFWAYDYATRHVAHNPQAPAADAPLVTDSLFADFKAFIDPARFKYDRQCALAIDLLRRAATAEGYATDSVQAQIDILADLLRHDLNHDLDFNRPAIAEILETELASRYYPAGEALRRSLATDSVYLKAREILLDQKEYTRLLLPADKK